MLNRALKYVQRQFSSELRKLVDYYGLTSADIHLYKDNIKLIKLNFTFPNKKKFYFIIKGYDLLLDIHNSYDLKITFNNNRILLYIKNVVQEIQSAEDIFILHEIYNNGVYNFSYPKKVIMIDIGLNVGYSSLYFATSKNVDKIFAFEPFTLTFEQAMKNITLNKNIANKIITFNFGLGKYEEIKELYYNYEWKGSAGIAELLTKLPTKVSVNKEKIILKPISDVYKEINLYDSTSSIGIKIDCEGAEYDFFTSLVNDPEFRRVEFIMLEWHIHGPNIFIKELLSHNFVCFSLLPKGKKTGFIYASRKNL